MSEMNALVEVRIMNKNLNQPFTYMVDLNLFNDIAYGDIVLVEFNNSLTTGMVVKVDKNAIIDDELTYQYKPVLKLLASQLLSVNSQKLYDYLNDKLFAKEEDIYRLILSKNRVQKFGLILSSKNSKKKDNEVAKELYGKLNSIMGKYFKGEVESKYSKIDKDDQKDILELVVNDLIDVRLEIPKISRVKVYKFSEEAFEKLFTDTMEKTTDKLRNVDKKIITYCEEYLNKKEFIRYYNLTDYRFRKLLKDEKIITFEVVKADEKRYTIPKSNIERVTLDDKQIEAYNNILESSKISLLHGVTGSGKTLIYLKIVEEAIKKGEKVLILVPEVTLTLQMIREIEKYFPKNYGYFYSGITPTEHYNLIQKLKNDEINIIIGTRSCIFLDIPGLTRVIVDEEHDSSYKQNVKPFYHVNLLYDYWKDQGIDVLLASATPSLLSYTKGLRGNYNLVELAERYNNYQLPAIEYRENSLDILQTDVVDEIKKSIEKEENVLLLFNVKGYSRSVECSTCGIVKACPNCRVSLKYFKGTNTLECSYCGYSEAFKRKCDACNHLTLQLIGIGIEQVEENLKEHFEDKLLRVDATISKNRKQVNEIIDRFQTEKGLILLGTQILAKGLNFPNLKKVMVLNTDSMLYFSDFQAHEQTYQLLEQISGRSGRDNNEGKVIIYTNHQEDVIYRSIKEHDYMMFYKDELLNRKLQRTVPYYYISMVEVRSVSDNLLDNKLKELQKKLEKAGLLTSDVVEPYVKFWENKYRRKLFVKYKQENIKEILMNQIKEMDWRGVDLLIDLEINAYGY